MMNNNKLIKLMAGVLFCLAGGTANAELSLGSANTLKGSKNISTVSSSNVTLRWTMTSSSTLTPSALPGPVITSTAGRFVLGRQTIPNNKVLSRTITPTNPPTVVNITENLLIPKTVLFTASKLGLSQIRYERIFTDCPVGPTGLCTPALAIAIDFNLAGDAAAGFAVTNYKLRFSNDQIAAIVQKSDNLKATASVNVNRTGVIRAVWEVATPATTIGQPSFKVIKTIQRQLNSVSTNEIKSPMLPTDSTGIYLVRFRFLDPQLDGEIPTLRYNVTERGGREEKQVKTISPRSGSALTPDTKFEWEPIPGANAYKLEIIEMPSGASPTEGMQNYSIVTGLLVKADDAETLINKAVAQHLKPGRTYWWHVIGLNPGGKPVGQSDWSSIKIQ